MPRTHQAIPWEFSVSYRVHQACARKWPRAKARARARPGLLGSQPILDVLGPRARAQWAQVSLGSGTIWDLGSMEAEGRLFGGVWGGGAPPQQRGGSGGAAVPPEKKFKLFSACPKYGQSSNVIMSYQSVLFEGFIWYFSGVVKFEYEYRFRLHFPSLVAAR